MIWLRFICTIVIAVTLTGLAQAQVNITTWQNDVQRTGQNLNETILTPGNLTAGNFGQLCSAALDGQVYAQPLVLSNVTFQGTQYASLVYVVTENNSLFVINGAPPSGSNSCAIVGSLSLNLAGQYPADCKYLGAQQCGTVSPTVGILGTPVIQTAQGSIGTLYAVTETQDVPVGDLPSNWYHYLHAVNLDQLAELTAPVQIVPQGPYPTLASQASYWSRHHIQRPGLLLVGNNLFIGMSMMDGPLPLANGAVFEYDVTNLNTPPVYFSTTPTFSGNGAGIWQGGSGLAYGSDESDNNYLYFNTGNGVWDANKNWGDSFIKLNPNTPGALTVADYFTPSDEYYRACTNPYTDVDFGSGGVLLTPSTANWPNLAISGDKEGGVWLMDRGHPGEFNPGQCPANCNVCPTTSQNNQNVQTYWLGNGTQPAIHNTPAYWNNYVYVAPVLSPIYQFQLCNNQGTGEPFCNSPITATGPKGGKITTNYGATPAISASSPTSNGILWLLTGANVPQPTNAGVLYAFDATTMKELYASSGTGSTCAADLMYPGTKFSVPTVANGYVYVGAESLDSIGKNNGQGTLYIFGLNRQCNQNAGKGKSLLHTAVRK
jgi:hypothetical protein